jgi:hypothetical protein
MKQKRWMKSVIAAAEDLARDTTKQPLLPWTRQARRIAQLRQVPRTLVRSA